MVPDSQLLPASAAVLKTVAHFDGHQLALVLDVQNQLPFDFPRSWYPPSSVFIHVAARTTTISVLSGLFVLLSKGEEEDSFFRDFSTDPS